tara:strand:+ start:94 stop:465 length:372 start_codon:yes stop_codon:yes gene_type:complete
METLGLILIVIVAVVIQKMTTKPTSESEKEEKLMKNPKVKKQLKDLDKQLDTYAKSVEKAAEGLDMKDIEGDEDYVEETEKMSAPKSKKVDIKEELKKYKDLLDDGLIEQDDYDSKKKELLGL